MPGEKVYERTRVTSSKASFSNFLQVPKNDFSSDSDEQHCVSDLTEESRGEYKKSQKSQNNDKNAKVISELLISNGIVKVEYLLSVLNKLAGLDSRRRMDSSEWMLNKMYVSG